MHEKVKLALEDSQDIFENLTAVKGEHFSTLVRSAAVLKASMNWLTIVAERPDMNAKMVADIMDVHMSSCAYLITNLAKAYKLGDKDWLEVQSWADKIVVLLDKHGN